VTKQAKTKTKQRAAKVKKRPTTCIRAGCAWSLEEKRYVPQEICGVMVGDANNAQGDLFAIVLADGKKYAGRAEHVGISGMLSYAPVAARPVTTTAQPPAQPTVRPESARIGSWLRRLLGIG